MKLGDFISLQRGYDLPVQDRTKGNVPVIGGGGPNGLHSEAKAKGPGVVIGRSGAGFGTAFYSQADFWPHNTGLFVTDFHDNIPLFVYYFLDAFNFSKYNSGGAQPSLNRNFIYPVNILIPPIFEQNAIANLISIWDATIEKINLLIKYKKKFLKALIQKHVIAPSMIKGLWAHKKICDIAKRIQRRSNEDELPILTISSASGFVLQEEKYSRYMAGESVKNYIRLRKGEFAYNKGNSLRYQFGCVFELKDYMEALVPNVYVCFKLNSEVDSDYLGHLFDADYLRHQLGAIVKTGVRNNGLLNIRPDEFMNVTIPIPPIDEQKQIASILNTAKRETSILEKQLDAYRRQKRGLMQKLLTGKWRVKIKEK